MSLMYLERQGFNAKYEIKPNVNVIRIGRRRDCDIVFDSTYVSRVHCEIRRIPPKGTLILRNLNASNSTHVDEIHLEAQNEEAELSLGCVIGLGIPTNLAKDSFLNESKFVFLKLCSLPVPLQSIKKEICLDASSENDSALLARNVKSETGSSRSQFQSILIESDDDDVIFIGNVDSKAQGSSTKSSFESSKGHIKPPSAIKKEFVDSKFAERNGSCDYVVPFVNDCDKSKDNNDEVTDRLANLHSVKVKSENLTSSGETSSGNSFQLSEHSLSTNDAEDNLMNEVLFQPLQTSLFKSPSLTVKEEPADIPPSEESCNISFNQSSSYAPSPVLNLPIKKENCEINFDLNENIKKKKKTQDNSFSPKPKRFKKQEEHVENMKPLKLVIDYSPEDQSQDQPCIKDCFVRLERVDLSSFQTTREISKCSSELHKEKSVFRNRVLRILSDGENDSSIATTSKRVKEYQNESETMDCRPSEDAQTFKQPQNHKFNIKIKPEVDERITTSNISKERSKLSEKVDCLPNKYIQPCIEPKNVEFIIKKEPDDEPSKTHQKHTEKAERIPNKEVQPCKKPRLEPDLDNVKIECVEDDWKDILKYQQQLPSEKVEYPTNEDHNSMEPENLEINIKTEPVENKSISFSYSQVDDIILISSDEEDESFRSDGAAFKSLGVFESGDSLPDIFPMPSSSKYVEGVDEIDMSDYIEREEVDLDDTGVVDEEKDEDWWPYLSQNFYKGSPKTIDDEKSKEESESKKKPGLDQIISRISNKTKKASKLTEFKTPLSKRKVRNEEKNKLKKSKIKTLSPTKVSIPSSPKVIVENKKIMKKKKSSLKKDLLRTHNFDPYLTSSGKENHHLVKRQNSSKPSEISKTIRKDDENISIQKPPKSRDQLPKKGIAKISKVNRSQKLTEFDLFGDNAEPKPKQKFKIPKKRSNSVDSVPNHTSAMPVLLESSKASYKSNLVEKPITESTDSTSGTSKILKQQTLNQTSTPKSAVFKLKSILRIHPKPTYCPRQNVRFPASNEELNLIRIIPRRTVKNCVGPKQVQSKEVFVKNKEPETSDENNPYKFIAVICHWNYDWLKTYQLGKKQDMGPPEVYHKPLPALTNYNSFDVYKQTFCSLIFYDLWERVYTDWEIKEPFFQNQAVTCEVDVNTNYFVNNLKFLKLKVIGFIEMARRVPEAGVLVGVRHALNSKACFTFAYVQSVYKKSSARVSVPLKTLSKPNANTVAIFDIIFFKSYIESLKPGEMISIFEISYVRPDFKIFESLCSLPESPFLKFILNPYDLSFLVPPYKPTSVYLVPEIPLSDEQKKIVVSTADKCSENQAKLTLIHGSPGTGKTRLITALLSQIICMFKSNAPGVNRRILLCAPSNAAVDELVSRVVELRKIGLRLNIVRVGVPQSMSPIASKYSLETLAKVEFDKSTMVQDPNTVTELNNKKKYIEQACEEFERAKRQGLPEADVQALEMRMVALLRAKEEFEKSCKVSLSSKLSMELHSKCKRKVLMTAEIIATTLNSSLSASILDAFKNYQTSSPFACCIVDEAGQCKETEIWLPLKLGISKLILVGDHLQLPATVISQLSLDKRFNQSFFERIYHHVGVERGEMKLLNGMTVQHRMNNEIWRFPSIRFYQNAVTTAPEVNLRTKCDLKPYLVFNVLGEETKGINGEISNVDEASFIQSMIIGLSSFLQPLSIGVLTPYKEQKRLLMEKLSHLSSLNISVSTIDNFQGQERDVIIISFVRSNSNGRIGFVKDRQRLNVALTRASKVCFVVGHIYRLKSNPDFRALKKDALKRDAFVSVPKKYNTDLYRLTRLCIS